MTRRAVSMLLRGGLNVRPYGLRKIMIRSCWGDSVAMPAINVTAGQAQRAVLGDAGVHRGRSDEGDFVDFVADVEGARIETLGGDRTSHRFSWLQC
jgi:hypothetical protein